jgi:hypothetical protein
VTLNLKDSELLKKRKGEANSEAGNRSLRAELQHSQLEVLRLTAQLQEKEDCHRMHILTLRELEGRTAEVEQLYRIVAAKL